MDPKAQAHELTERFNEMWKSFGEMAPDWSKLGPPSEAAKEFWEGLGKTGHSNMEALKDLNAQMASSVKSIGERQMSLMETMMGEAEAAAKEMRAAGEAAPDAASQAFHKMLDGMKEMAEIAKKANRDALAEIEKHGETFKAELKEMMAKSKT